MRSGLYVLDSEGNSLDKGGGALSKDITESYCWVFKDQETGEMFHCDKFNGFEGLRETIENARMLVCHNILDFDLPVLKRLFNIQPPEDCVIIDTLVWSRALYPDRAKEGGHGLEAWGKRNGIPKPAIETWEAYTPDVLDRCYEDVKNNEMTFKKLLQEASMYDSGDFLKLEQNVAKLVSDMCKRGIRLDIPLCQELVEKLTDRIKEVDETLDKLCDVKPVKFGVPVTKLTNKNGSYPAMITDWYGEQLKDENFSISAGACTEEHPEIFHRIQWEKYNYRSNDQMVKVFSDAGYKPIELTAGGSPKITEEAFNLQENSHLKQFGLALCKRRVLTHRLDMVKGWLENVDEDGRIRMYCNPQGTVTLRMSHQRVVNVPKAKDDEPLSEFYRACFISSLIQEGEKDYGLEWSFTDQSGKEHTVVNQMAQVGCDASGLENRVLAHYLNDDELTEKIVTDFHTFIWKAVDKFLHSRNSTKNWEYAFFFGAMDLKLGSMLDYVEDITQEEAREIGWKQISKGKNKGLWSNGVGKPVEWELVKYAHSGMLSRRYIAEQVPQLGDLIATVQEESRKGYVVSLDGRRLIMRRGFDGKVQEHKSLNTKIQGGGAVVMKVAGVIFFNWIAQEGIRCWLINWIHDELQVECYPSDRFRVAQLLEAAIAWAGEYLKMNVPMAGESLIGVNWSQTH